MEEKILINILDELKEQNHLKRLEIAINLSGVISPTNLDPSPSTECRIKRILKEIESGYFKNEKVYFSSLDSGETLDKISSNLSSNNNGL